MDTQVIPSPQPSVISSHKAFDVSILAGLVRPSTAAMYVKKLRLYLDFAGSTEEALIPSTLARWRTELAQGNLSPNTINLNLSAVKSLLDKAAAQGYISRQIADDFKAIDGASIKAMRDKLKPNARTKISKEDMRLICNKPKADTLAGKMHRAFLHTMASSGARISEVITLTPQQIEIDKGSYVILVTGKTDILPRKAPLTIEAYKAVQEWLTARAAVGVSSQYIFTGFTGRGSRGPRSTHIRLEAGSQIVKRYTKLCGLPNIKPHDFRRFVGTTLAAKDPRHAQQALGHKDISITYRHYVLDEMPSGLTEGMY